MASSGTRTTLDEPRGWVVRLGSYLRIFGRQAAYNGVDPIRPNDGLVEKAQRREAEFGGSRRGN